MLHQQIHFEWHVCEDESAWESLPLVNELPVFSSRPMAINVDHRAALQLLSILTLCAVSLMTTGGTAVTPLDRERAHTMVSMEAFLSQANESPTQRGQSEALPVTNDQSVGDWLRTWYSLQPPVQSTPGAKQVSLLRVDPLDNFVLAEVLVKGDVANWRFTGPYRETRAYRETEEGWQLISLDQHFWGPATLLHTDHFRFELFVRDAPVVLPVTEQLQQLYVDLHQVLGMEVPTTTVKLAIEITAKPINNRSFLNNRLQVASPIMAQVPAELSPSDYLLHRIARTLIYQVINLRRETTGDMVTVYDNWQPVRRGLRTWLQNDLLLQRWPWDEEAARLFQSQSRARLPLKLTAVTERSEDQLTNRSAMMWQSAAAESMIDYAVQTYGRERLPDLVQGFRTYSAWSELIPHVFGDSVEEFEAGWNHQLAQSMKETEE
jgi:hypothetical protein